jgi:hypothetical protein
MKKYIIYAGIIFISILNIKLEAASNKSNSTTLMDYLRVDTLITDLTSLNLNQFNGLPVDSLLSHLPQGYISTQITGWRSIRLAEILHVVYPNNVVVEIHVKNFQYMNPHWVNTGNPTQNWSVALFRKEAVAFAVIFNGTTCINGCQNKYK